MNPNQRRLYRAAQFARGRILDIGFAKSPNLYLEGEVTGYDIIKEPLYEAKNYSGCVQGDIRELTKKFSPGSFDTVVATEFIEHIEGHLSFFSDCNTLLKPKGLLIISIPTPLHYRTLIGNLLFPRGNAKYRGHISTYIPRVLNNIAKESGFDLIWFGDAVRGRYSPLITSQLMFVYRKVRKPNGINPGTRWFA